MSEYKTITIGEFDPVTNYQERHTLDLVRQSINEVEEAPVYRMDKNNFLFMREKDWQEFIGDVDLVTLFSHDSKLGLGLTELKEDHYDIFKSARKIYSLRDNKIADHEKMLEWLVFWSRWALDNCEYPTFKNSI